MKNLLIFIATIFTVTLLIYAVGFAVPKILEIYKTDNVEIKPDTVYYRDTVYFEKTTGDTLPKYKYETIIKHDTLYKLAKGDSIEKIPRVITLKKKSILKHYPLGVIR